jgi:hypothetical protein
MFGYVSHIFNITDQREVILIGLFGLSGLLGLLG